MPHDAPSELLHGTAVLLNNRALFIRGKSGSGKSCLAIDLISRGATLVSDDRVAATRKGEGAVLLSAPSRIEGIIEARGVGLLETPTVTGYLCAVVDLDVTDEDRLPELHETVIAGEVFQVLRKVESPVFAAMLTVYLKGGRRQV